jgi:hypothetical protein
MVLLREFEVDEEGKEDERGGKRRVLFLKKGSEGSRRSVWPRDPGPGT